MRSEAHIDTQRRRALIAGVAAVSLIVGFAVAQFSGVRILGAVVLVAGGAWCAVALWRICGLWPTAAVGVVYAAAFAVSHPLGKVIGTWPAVLLVAAVTGAVAYGLSARVPVRS